MTIAGSVRFEITGAERALLYQLAAESGLRVGELGSLTPASFKLDATPPTVTVSASYSKRRREDIVPLRRSTAELLATALRSVADSDPVFHLPDKPARMLRDDLEAARSHWIKQGKPGADRQHREGSSFLVYRTDAGVADFHALRHTFITNLARGGVHPKIAQDLARHSDINLTMSR